MLEDAQGWWCKGVKYKGFSILSIASQSFPVDGKNAQIGHTGPPEVVGIITKDDHDP